jgi:hypothetical protein
MKKGPIHGGPGATDNDTSTVAPTSARFTNPRRHGQRYGVA